MERNVHRLLFLPRSKICSKLDSEKLQYYEGFGEVGGKKKENDNFSFWEKTNKQTTV